MAKVKLSGKMADKLIGYDLPENKGKPQTIRFSGKGPAKAAATMGASYGLYRGAKYLNNKRKDHPNDRNFKTGVKASPRNRVGKK